MSSPGILAVDIGQTGFRLRIDDGSGVAIPFGVHALTGNEQVKALVARILKHLPTPGPFTAIGIGLSGFVEGSPAPATLADEIHSLLQPRSTVVAADAVTAFLGTIGARAGTIAICGTGVAAPAAAFGIVRELVTMEDYAVPQAWAAAFDAAGFGGVFYGSAYTTGEATALALFAGTGTPLASSGYTEAVHMSGPDACVSVGMTVMAPPPARGLQLFT